MANVQLTGNFLATARCLIFADGGGITWTFNPNTNTLQASGSGGGVTGLATPTAEVGLTAVAGSLSTAMRSDGAPALNQSIVPTWTGLHTFNAGLTVGGGAATIGPPATAVPALAVVGQNGAIAMTVQGGFAAPTFPSASFNGSAQFYGLSVSHVNQNVTLSQIYIHGGEPEMVTINGASGTDTKVWSSFADASGVYHLLRLENDALTGINECVTFTRTGYASQVMTWYASYGPAAVFSTPALGGTYLLAITSPNTASASYGMKIQAGTNSTDVPFGIVNAANTANILQILGDGEVKIGAATPSGVTCLQVSGVASSTAPCATFGGAASNFITVTDGAGIVTVLQSSTGVGGVVGTSSNNPLTINTNGAIRAVVGAAGGITVVNGLSMYNVAPPSQVTGWGTPTGAAVVANFSGAAGTLVNCSNAIAQIITDLKRFGIYAA